MFWSHSLWHDSTNGKKQSNDKYASQWQGGDQIVWRLCFGQKSSLTYPTSDEASRSKKIRKFFHSNVRGPMSLSSLGGPKYYVFFIDDFNGYHFVFCIKNKTKVIKCFKNVKA